MNSERGTWASITAAARRLQQEQRALLQDGIGEVGRPLVFWGLLGLSAVLSLVLDALPGWISALCLVAISAGMWRAGKSALERRSHST